MRRATRSFPVQNRLSLRITPYPFSHVDNSVTELPTRQWVHRTLINLADDSRVRNRTMRDPRKATIKKKH